MTKFYLIPKRLKDFFGFEPLTTSDPDLSVARGAVYYHYCLHKYNVRKLEDSSSSEKTNVCTSALHPGIAFNTSTILNDTINIGLRGEYVSQLIPAGTELPYKSEEIRDKYKLDKATSSLGIEMFLGRGKTKNRRSSSKYSDGLIGWQKLPPRAQDTLYRWEYDDSDNLIGMTQQPPPDYGLFTIPMSKAMLFRTESVKDNPEGRSILRNAYRSWYFKRRIQEIEAIGIERDLAGLPVIHAPERLEIWDSQDPDMVKINAALITMVKNLRRNESEGLVLPYGYEAELLSTGGTRQFDTNAIINRYDTKIAQTVLADFIMLGHEKTGSFALSSDKTELFSVALGAFLDVICETFNNQGIPSLIDINGSHFDGIEDYPTLAHGDVDKRDITKLSTFLKDMVGTGILIPDEELEDYVREAANLPERTEVPDSREKDERREAQRRAPEKTANEPDGPEVDPEENQDAEEAKKRLGR